MERAYLIPGKAGWDVRRPVNAVAGLLLRKRVMASYDTILIVAGVVALVATYLRIVHSFISKAEDP